MRNNTKGFTLIELLVVIAIIGILATISMIALGQARARSRDAKRIADVRQMQTALAMYYNDNNDYPDTNSVQPGDSITSNGTVYLKSVPTPPSVLDGDCPATNAYTYEHSGTSPNSSYTIAYCIGKSVGDIPAGSIQYASPAGMH